MKRVAGRETLVLGKPISFARLLGLLAELATAPADPVEPSSGVG